MSSPVLLEDRQPLPATCSSEWLAQIAVTMKVTVALGLSVAEMEMVHKKKNRSFRNKMDDDL